MDLYKILDDVKNMAIGLKPGTQEMQKGYFVAWRDIGLPVNAEDYENPADIFELMEAEEAGDPYFSDEAGDLLGEVSEDGISDEAFEEESKMGDEASFFRTFLLSNSKINMNGNFKVEPGTQNVASTWEGIIKGAEIDIQSIILDGEKKRLFDEVAAKITPELERKVQKALAKVESAEIELIEKYSEYFLTNRIGLWRQIGKIYQRRLDSAKRKYRTVARDYDRYMALLDSQGVDPASFLISKAKTVFDQWSLQLGVTGTIPYTMMTPSDWYEADADGWTTYSESSYKREQSVTESSTSIKAKPSFFGGMFAVGAGASYGSEKSNISIDVESFSLSFSYKIVRVERPWMDTSILNLKNWYLKSETNQPYEVNSISDGSFNQVYENKPNVFLPSVITGLILAKDVELSWENSDFDSTSVQTTLKAGGSIGYGPFKLGGSYGKKNSSETESETYDEKSLRMEGVQIIGYVSQIMPASPFKASILDQEIVTEEGGEEAVNPGS